MSDPEIDAPGGWSMHQKQPPFPTYTFYKEFAYGRGALSALVFVYRREAGYEVRSRALVASTPPADDAEEGHRLSVEEALVLAVEVCQRFEERYS